MLRLATGQQMARFLRSKGVNVKTLTRAQIKNGKGGAELDGLTKAQLDAFLRDTPLWFYVLREAELGSGRLRGVGARLVAETFHRAMEEATSRSSATSRSPRSSGATRASRWSTCSSSRRTGGSR